jgi:hypothetical protein
VKGEDGETIMSDLDDLMDIITLCEALIAIVPNAGLKVTLPMLGRVALLVCPNTEDLIPLLTSVKRQVLIDISGGSKYWEKVDEQLALLRTKYEDDEAYFKVCLHLIHFAPFSSGVHIGPSQRL